MTATCLSEPTIDTERVYKLQATALNYARNHMQSCQSSGALKWEETAELQAVLKADRENPFKIPDVSRLSVAAQKVLEAMCQDEQYRGVNAWVVGYGIVESDLQAHREWVGMYEDMMAVERKRKGMESGGEGATSAETSAQWSHRHQAQRGKRAHRHQGQ